jgi:hypothetical protein
VQPSDGDAGNALDSFDLEFANDMRNIRIRLVTDGFTPFGENTTSYSCWLMFAVS